MAFVMFLACLFKIGALKTNQDEPAVGLIVFDRYKTVPVINIPVCIPLQLTIDIFK